MKLPLKWPAFGFIRGGFLLLALVIGKGESSGVKRFLEDLKILLASLLFASVMGLAISAKQQTETVVQGQIIIGLQTNTSDVMKSEVEKVETVKIEEVHSIRFEHENTLWEVPFKTRLISESVTNMVKQETWTPKLTVPPLPINPNPVIESRFVTNTRSASIPLPTRYGPKVPLPHPDIPR